MAHVIAQPKADFEGTNCAYYIVGLFHGWKLSWIVWK